MAKAKRHPRGTQGAPVLPGMPSSLPNLPGPAGGRRGARETQAGAGRCQERRPLPTEPGPGDLLPWGPCSTSGLSQKREARRDLVTRGGLNRENPVFTAGIYDLTAPSPLNLPVNY